MPRDDDHVFLRSAVECGALDPSAAEEVLAALEQVAALGASSSAREIALNRGLLTPAQADQAQAGSKVKEATPVRRTKRLGNFEIVAKLGVGGMGVVYKARQLSMDRLVALKVLPRRLAKDRSFIERFLREARSAARLNHPHIVQGIDVGEADGLYYFAMELVEGESLRDRIRREGRLAQAEALRIARQVVLALEHANAHHIVHRDIKPDNILLTGAGAAKLADLGLAKRKSDAAVTQLAAPLGTPLYMSPEQARGKTDIDTRGDIYSLGATLYHTVVGAPPFTGPNATAIITKHLFETPASPRASVPDLSEGLCAMLRRMLAKRPVDRYQSPAELLEDIDRLLEGRPPVHALRRERAERRTTSTKLRRSRRARRRSPLVPIFATTTVFLLATGLWLLYDSLAGATEQPAVVAPKPEPREAYPRRARPVPKPKPRRKPKPRPARRPDPAAAARAELERTRQWARANADTPAEIIRRFRALAARYPDTPVAAAAEAEARKAEDGVRAEAKSALFEVCHEAKRLASQHKFAAAVEVLDRFGAEHREFLDEASEERGFILSQALRTERETRTRAGQLAAKGDYPGAIALYNEIVGFGIPKLAARAKHEIALLEAQHAEAERKARHEAEEAYLALRLRLRPLLADRRYPQARSLLASALDDAAMAPVRDGLEADAGDLAAVEALWAAAEQGARSLKPAERFSVGGIRGQFVRFAKGELHVRASGLLCKKALRELTGPEVLALARRGLPKGKAATEMACGLFLLAEGKPKAAAKAFAKGKAMGADAARHLALIERLATDSREAEADALFARLGELKAAGQWKQVAEALRAYEHGYGASRSFARHRGETVELALEARLATLEVCDLFHGKCRPAGNGHRVEVVYDFQDREQLADWELRGPQWTVAEGRLVLTGSRAIWRPGLGRDVQATAQLTDASGPPGLWGMALTEGPEAKPLYTLELPERIGLKAALRAQRREVALGPAPFRLQQPRKLAFAVRSRRVAVALDGKDVLSWSDEDGRLRDGFRLAIGSEGERTVHVSHVHVVAPVDEPWASDELERLRVRLHKGHELAGKPWRSLCNGVSLDPWRAEHGNWQPRDGALATEFGGNLVLDEGQHENLELRLKLRPTTPRTVVRVAFRVARNGGFYGLTLGTRACECTLALHHHARARDGGVLARLAPKVAWKPGQWYDLRIVAVGSELRAELDGELLCLVRDDRRHRGHIALEVLHGGAAFKDMALRSLE